MKPSGLSVPPPLRPLARGDSDRDACPPPDVCWAAAQECAGAPCTGGWDVDLTSCDPQGPAVREPPGRDPIRRAPRVARPGGHDAGAARRAPSDGRDLHLQHRARTTRRAMAHGPTLPTRSRRGSPPARQRDGRAEPNTGALTGASDFQASVSDEWGFVAASTAARPPAASDFLHGHGFGGVMVRGLFDSRLHGGRPAHAVRRGLPAGACHGTAGLVRIGSRSRLP